MKGPCPFRPGKAFVGEFKKGVRGKEGEIHSVKKIEEESKLLLTIMGGLKKGKGWLQGGGGAVDSL